MLQPKFFIKILQSKPKFRKKYRLTEVQNRLIPFLTILNSKLHALI